MSPMDPIVNQTSAINATSAATSRPSPTAAALNSSATDLHPSEEIVQQLNKTALRVNHTSIPATLGKRSDHVNRTSSVNRTVDAITKRGPLEKYDKKEDASDKRIGDRILLLHDQESRSSQTSISGPDGRSDEMETTDPFDPDAFMLEHVHPSNAPPGPLVGTDDHVLSSPDMEEADEPTKMPEPVIQHQKGKHEDDKPLVVLPFPYTMREIESHGKVDSGPPSKSKPVATTAAPTAPCPTSSVAHVSSEAPHSHVKYDSRDIDLSTPEEGGQAVHLDPDSSNGHSQHSSSSRKAFDSKSKPQEHKAPNPPSRQPNRLPPHRIPGVLQSEVDREIDHLKTTLNMNPGDDEEEEDNSEEIETRGPSERLFASTKPYFFPDLLLSFTPASALDEKSEAAAKSVEMDPNPNFLSVSSVTISPILRKKVRPLFEALTSSSSPIPFTTKQRGHKDRLFSVELLKEEDEKPRPIWYKTHNADLVEPLDYDYISRITGEKTLEKDLYSLVDGFRLSS